MSRQEKDFEQLRSSGRTVVRYIETMANDDKIRSNEQIIRFQAFTIALNENRDASYIAEQAILTRKVNFNITEELLALKSSHVSL